MPRINGNVDLGISLLALTKSVGKSLGVSAAPTDRQSLTRLELH